MPLLAGLRVVQLGPGLAAAVSGRLFADVGATVMHDAANGGEPLDMYLDHGKARSIDADRDVAAADLVIVEGSPSALQQRGHDAAALRRLNTRAVLILISPFGQTGPRRNEPATDLTLCCASSIARLLTGQVDDLDEAPIRPVGEQSAFIGGIAAACAGMHAALGATPGAVIDVSLQEALATLAITELARAGQGGGPWSRKRRTDGNGATVCILPTRDGYVAISPRETHQWAAWLDVMGSPAWRGDPRFADKPARVANWDALHALMSQWSRERGKQEIADAAQTAHVPSFPLCEPMELLRSAQLAHRRFYRPVPVGAQQVLAPGAPFGLSTSQGSAGPPASGPLPLHGVRVLDFSWVIAGPTATRYLAAMGAEVIKVEAPGRGDPGRASELHGVLGQGKRGIVLDLKRPDDVAVARGLAAKSDVLIENFATGVMDRLGLGTVVLRAANPNLIVVSASGAGRTGPEAGGVAYGTLLQCNTGFAGLNRHPDAAPRVGFAWLDPMCGLMLAFVTAAALWQRWRAGGVARIDFSMTEAMLWTMAEPLLATQLSGPVRPLGNMSPRFAPHGVFRCAGDDAWVAVVATSDAAWQGLCRLVPALSAQERLAHADRLAGRETIDRVLAAWIRQRAAADVAMRLQQVGVCAAPLATAADLVGDAHLSARGFWDQHGTAMVPGLPWRASFGRRSGPAPGLGTDTLAVLRDVLGLERSPAGTSLSQHPA
jgi:crotonobetainyl-CoA:carnitine CoA-transferase CaiB-like acyl-CoA transferase